jgi:hypothetical protein
VAHTHNDCPPAFPGPPPHPGLCRQLAPPVHRVCRQQECCVLMHCCWWLRRGSGPTAHRQTHRCVLVRVITEHKTQACVSKGGGGGCRANNAQVGVAIYTAQYVSILMQDRYFNACNMSGRNIHAAAEGRTFHWVTEPGSEQVCQQVCPSLGVSCCLQVLGTMVIAYRRINTRFGTPIWSSCLASEQDQQL